MHTSSMVRMKWFKENYLSPISSAEEKISIMDVGSGSGGGDTYRECFSEPVYKYTGLDLAKGLNVDVVLQSPYRWHEINDSCCDAVISGQAFEHIEFPWIVILEITRILKPGGLVCIIAPNGLGLHRHPVDCWRFYSDGMVALARYAGLEVLHVSTNQAPKNASPDWYSRWQDCMLVAKKPLKKSAPVNIDSYHFVPAKLEELDSGFIPAEEQTWYKTLPAKMKLKKILKILLWPAVLIRRYILKRHRRYVKRKTGAYGA